MVKRVGVAIVGVSVYALIDTESTHRPSKGLRRVVQGWMRVCEDSQMSVVGLDSGEQWVGLFREEVRGVKCSSGFSWGLNVVVRVIGGGW